MKIISKNNQRCDSSNCVIQINPRFVFTPQQLGVKKLPKTIDVYITYEKTSYDRGKTYHLIMDISVYNKYSAQLHCNKHIMKSNFIKYKGIYWEEYYATCYTQNLGNKHPNVLYYIFGKHKIL